MPMAMLRFDLVAVFPTDTSRHYRYRDSTTLIELYGRSVTVLYYAVMTIFFTTPTTKGMYIYTLRRSRSRRGGGMAKVEEVSLPIVSGMSSGGRPR